MQEGITTAVLLGDPLLMLDAGATGLEEVDAWVRAHNPHRIDRAGKMLGLSTGQSEQTSRLR